MVQTEFTAIFLRVTSCRGTRRITATVYVEMHRMAGYPAVCFRFKCRAIQGGKSSIEDSIFDGSGSGSAEKLKPEIAELTEANCAVKTWNQQYCTDKSRFAKRSDAITTRVESA